MQERRQQILGEQEVAGQHRDDHVHGLGKLHLFDAPLNAPHDVLQAVGARDLVGDRNDVLGLHEIDAACAEPRRHQPMDPGAGADVEHDAVRSDRLRQRGVVRRVATRVKRHRTMAGNGEVAHAS
jgi:hypothetical protein